MAIISDHWSTASMLGQNAKTQPRGDSYVTSFQQHLNIMLSTYTLLTSDFAESKLTAEESQIGFYKLRCQQSVREHPIICMWIYKSEQHSDLLTMKRQWTYGPTLLPWFDHFHTSLACFTALCCLTNSLFCL